MANLTHTRQQLEHTWQRFRSTQAPRVLRDHWPQVMPLPGGGPERTQGPHLRATDVPRAEESAHAWLTALVAFDELQSYRELDTLLRRSVELVRSALSLERAALFLLSDDQTLYGTFGTGLSGETTDERHISFELGKSHREAFALTNSGLAQWSRFPNVPLFAQRANRTVVLRMGENVIVPIPARGTCMGLIACDNGLSGSKLSTEVLIRTAVFARIVGPLLLPFATSLTERRRDSTNHALLAPHVAGNTHQELIGKAIARLRLDPNEPRAQIAKALGTSADRLGRSFKAEMGESLPEYRNKLRLQRFLALVDPNGGDLLSCALAAGFGSYAQFNRVFHQCHGIAPITYLRQRRGEA